MAEELARMGRLLSLRGRCSRAFNGWFFAIYFGCFLATLLIWAIVGVPLWPMIVGLIIVFTLPGVIISVRRLHDVGLSGWFILLYAIPVVGLVFSWSVVFKRGQVGRNRYADDPLKLPGPRPSRPGPEWARAVVGGLAVTAVVFGFRILAFQPFTIPSAAMEPSLYPGDYVFVSKFAYGFSKHSIPFSPPLFHGRLFNQTPQRGDIVVFKLPRDPNVDYIKRLIGMPGDRIQVKSGVVFVNGQPMDRKRVGVGSENIGGGVSILVEIYRETTAEGRSYLTNSYREKQVSENTGIYAVPPHCYFVMGDDRDNSLDSRMDPGMSLEAIGPSNCGWDSSVDRYIPPFEGVGYVPEENLVGRAVLAIAPAGKPRWRWLAGG